ncbi:hypothetical protein [Aliidiomarina shirensis]|uniref:hypothetical protein n=1 Tax=Aliidiomarina shirensis TaxID=1048642 RepID=UPI00130059BA|nr:hypothetical protein [Aliidiomarina shirensis]
MIRLQLPAELTKNLLNEEQSNAQVPISCSEKPEWECDEVSEKNTHLPDYNDVLNTIN